MALNVHSETSFFFSKMAKKAKNGQKSFACCKTRNLNIYQIQQSEFTPPHIKG